MPNISVIFPMYNVEKYVANSIMSVLNQTYRDYEIIAINDGSTDLTETIFNKTVSENNKEIFIKLINKPNGGLSDARNAGLEFASGNWVVFIDSDDIIHPKYLEVLVNDSISNNADLCIGSYKKVTKDQLFNFSSVTSGTIINKKKLMKLMLSRKKFDAYCGCFLVKRELLINKDISFNKDVKFSVDQAFMWNVIDESEVITINYSKIYNYFLREGSIMTSSNLKKISSGLNHYTTVISSLKNMPFSSSVVINRWKLGILHSTAKLCTFDQFINLKKTFYINYFECFKVPLFKTKVFSIIGLLSDKLLYNIFKKY